MATDFRDIEYMITKALPERGYDVLPILDAIYVSELGTQGILKAIGRERKLTECYRDRAKYPHLRGGRPNKVQRFTDIWNRGNLSKEVFWELAGSELSRRSLYRLKVAIVNS